MFKVGDLKVFFKHAPNETGAVVRVIRDQEVLTPYNGTTTCFVEKGDEILYEATAYCGLKDKFNKIDGRKESLFKVLRANFSKEDRIKFWDEYFKVVGSR